MQLQSSAAINPHERQWMLFVDGENLTIRAQKIAASKQLRLVEGLRYKKDCFFWFEGAGATVRRVGGDRILDTALRAYFYTSLVGDESALGAVRQQIKNAGFSPEVFKKPRGQEKAKGVDIALTKDV